MTYEQDDLAAENERLRQENAELRGEPKSIDVQIAEAEAAGDWGTSIRLKTQMHQANELAAQESARPAPDEATLAQIAEMEAADDWTGAAQARLAAFVDSQSPPAPDPEVVAQVEALEAEGKFAESIRLKLQSSGLSYLIPRQ